MISKKFNISLREKVRPQPILATSPFIPAYQCMMLPIEKLVEEKIDALFRRKKPRDYFDLYYFLRQRMAAEKILPFKKKLFECVDALEAKGMRKELRLLLPSTHQGLLQNFPTLLTTELKRL